MFKNSKRLILLNLAFGICSVAINKVIEKGTMELFAYNIGISFFTFFLNSLIGIPLFRLSTMSRSLRPLVWWIVSLISLNLISLYAESSFISADIIVGWLTKPKINYNPFLIYYHILSFVMMIILYLEHSFAKPTV